MSSTPETVELPGSVANRGQVERTMSAGSRQYGDAGKEEEKENLPVVPLLRIMKMNRKETPFIILGCLASLVNGTSQPAFALIFAEMLAVRNANRARAFQQLRN